MIITEWYEYNPLGSKTYFRKVNCQSYEDRLTLDPTYRQRKSRKERVRV